MSLDFVKPKIEDFDMVYAYTSRYGEGSCQHSFVTFFSMQEKYGDMICEEDGFLFVYRSGLSDEDCRVYLAPFGQGDVRGAFEKIFSDAASYGKKTKFFTLTQHYKDFIEREFPGRFAITGERDLFEYFYTYENQAEYPGKKLKQRRLEYRHFWNEYGDRAAIYPLERKDHAEVMEFLRFWILCNSEDHDMAALNREAEFIGHQLADFEKLHLSGIVLRIDGRICGFGYGTRLSEDCYDAIIEKGDKDIPRIYRVLRAESVKRCAGGCRYINLEEDLGVPGLRNLKQNYRPEYLLEKYIAEEM